MPAGSPAGFSRDLRFCGAQTCRPTVAGTGALGFSSDGKLGVSSLTRGAGADRSVSSWCEIDRVEKVLSHQTELQGQARAPPLNLLPDGADCAAGRANVAAQRAHEGAGARRSNSLFECQPVV